VINFEKNFLDYKNRLVKALDEIPIQQVVLLANSLFAAWQSHKVVYLCGNGGSAANAMHIANDFIYGVGGGKRPGISVEALTSNSAVITCLANDTGYEEIFSRQLEAKGAPGDILLALSGSGNSKNIVNALSAANNIGMTTFAILGYDGGRCKVDCKHPIHIPVHDMQISEDIQLIVAHMCMQFLKET
jgi:D-sedoheptulose 7-phosphate isomerase